MKMFVLMAHTPSHEIIPIGFNEVKEELGPEDNQHFIIEVWTADYVIGNPVPVIMAILTMDCGMPN